MNKLVSALALLCFVSTTLNSATLTTYPAQATVVNGPMLDNFNSGHKPNLWLGDYNCFASANASASMSYDATNAYLGTGYCLRLRYTVNSLSTFSGIYFELYPGAQPVNLSAYKQLSFFCKSSLNAKSLKVELKNAAGQVSSLYVYNYLNGGITDGWKQVKMPFQAFAAITDFKNITVLSFVFEYDYLHNNGFSTDGIVYLDNISFLTTL
jgi:hypothetical protein